MTIKTTLTIDRAIYKAAKRIAVEQETTVSSMVRKGLLIYCSDPEGVEDTVGLLMDHDAMKAIRAGKAARQRGEKSYYIDWDEVRDV